jgi:hypothetical protein
MLIKIGNKYFSPDIEPIMIMLSPEDKANIAQMGPAEETYVCYPEHISEDEIKKFMENKI